MGSTHNQDHYKVAGSKLEDRGVARRDRRRMSEEHAQLQNKATAKAPPRTPARKPPSPAKVKKKKAASGEKAASRTNQKTQRDGASAKSEKKQTPRPKTRAAAATKKKPKTSTATSPRAELVEIRHQRPKTASSAPRRLEDASASKPLRQAVQVAEQTGQLVRRLVVLAVDVLTAPVTIVRLARQVRRRDSHDPTPHSRK